MEISKEKLQEILAAHEKWVLMLPGGKRADLRYADLTGVNLNNKNLQFALLTGARLKDASLREADLSYACLDYAILKDADLTYKIPRCVFNIYEFT